MKHFRKLKIASAISLAITAALPAHAVINIEGDVQLTDESYTEGLQWTPDNAGDALELNNVTVDEPTKNASGVLVTDMDGNDILIKGSDIKGGFAGYALRIDNAVGSNVLVENTVLDANGGNPYLIMGKTLSETTLALKDVTVAADSLTDGSRGISLDTVSEGSAITLDNTKVSNATDAIYISTDLNDSALTVQNGSEISGIKVGIYAAAVSNGSTVTVDNSTVYAGNSSYALKLDNITDSNILISNSELKGTGGNPYLFSSKAVSGSTLTFKDSLLDAATTELTGGGSRGISLDTVSEGSAITLDNTKVINVTDAGISITTDLNDSAMSVQNGSEISSVKNGIFAAAVSNGSTLTVDNSKVSGDNTGFTVTTLDGSAMNLQNGSEVSGGQDGISGNSVTHGSTLTVDGAKVSGGTGSGIYTATLDGSALNVQNGSEVSGGDAGIYVNSVTNDSTLAVDGAKVIGGENATSGIRTGIRIKELNNSELNVQNGSQIIASKTGVSVGSSQNGIINITDSELSVGVGTENQTFGVQVTGDNTTLNIERSKIYVESGPDALPIRLVDSSNSTVNINDSEISGYAKDANGNLGMSSGVYVQSSSDSLVNVNNSTVRGDIFVRDSNNTVINVSNSYALNGVGFSYSTDSENAGTNNTVNFDNSVLEGSIQKINRGGGPYPKQDSHVNLTNGSSWIATGKSNIENISVTDSTVDMQDAVVNADNWMSQNADVLVNSGSSLNIDTGTGDMNVVIKSDGKELETAETTIINVNNGDMDIQADATDIGAYKYDLVEQDGKWVLVLAGTQPDETKPDETKPDETKPDETKPDETKPDETKPDETNPDETKPDETKPDETNPGETKPVHPILSNSANAVLSSLAAAQASWNSQTTALYERMASRLEKDTGGIWGTYYGNEWAGEAGESSTFNQKISGLAIGADKTLSLKSGTLTLGAAIMRDYSHLSDFDEQGSGGSMNSTALQAYGNLALDNGLFFKGTASAGRTDSKIHARSSDGSLARGDYKQTLFGLTGQAGYRYMVTENVYVAPYAQMNTYTASGADFKLDNGMKVSSDRYWSARGELGVEAGVKTSVGGITVTPHIMAAGSHEFVKNNDVHLNDLNNGFNNTVDGSGYRFGAGVEAQLTKSFSAGINVSYSRSKDVEQRYGINAGLRYSF